MKLMLDMTLMKFPVLLSRRKKYQFYLQTIFYAFKSEKVRFLHQKAFNILQENPIHYGQVKHLVNDVNWLVVKWFYFFIKISGFFGVIVINDFDYKNNTIKNDAKMA